MTRPIDEYGLTIGGRHSFDDLGLMFSKKPVLTTPQPRRVTRTVPYSDGSIDASMVFGRQFYDTRTLTCAWQVVDDDTVAMERAKAALTDWLLGATAGTAIEGDDYPNFVMTGAISSVTDSYDEEDNVLTVEAVFEIQPYRGYYQEVDFGYETVDFDTEIACTATVTSTDSSGNSGKVYVDGKTYTVGPSGKAVSLEAGSHRAKGLTSGNTNNISISVNSVL